MTSYQLARIFDLTFDYILYSSFESAFCLTFYTVIYFIFYALLKRHIQKVNGSVIDDIVKRNINKRFYSLY